MQYRRTKLLQHWLANDTPSKIFGTRRLLIDRLSIRTIYQHGEFLWSPIQNFGVLTYWWFEGGAIPIFSGGGLGGEKMSANAVVWTMILELLLIHVTAYVSGPCR